MKTQRITQFLSLVRAVFVAVIAMAAFSVSVHAQNLVVDPGFELGSPAWTFIGDSGRDPVDPAHTGSWCAFVTMSTTGRVSQIINTIPGKLYLVEFWLGYNGYNGYSSAGSSVSVSFGNTVGLVQTSDSTPWTTYVQHSFTALATGSTTAFTFAGNLNGGTFFLDDVSVSPVGEGRDSQYYFSNFVGSPGVSGSADGIGSAAQFNTPWGIAVDAAGNVYVTDFQNQTIRKVTSGGAVTTLAGSPGAAGSADGTGSAAQFYYPFGVAVDAAGNLFVADTGNYTIRKVTPAGAVTTLAGQPGQPGSANGTGSAAQFGGPFGVAADAGGNIFVADGNSTIRKVTPDGVVTTLAGQPGITGSANGTGSAAQFYGPVGVAVDGAGNVYVVDSGNNTIRKVTPAGVVTTLAGTPGVTGSNDGTGSAAQFCFGFGFGSGGGIGVDPGGNIFVADTGNNTIRKVTPAGMVTTIAGEGLMMMGADNGIGSAALFWNPTGVAVDASGKVYVADFNNSRISVGVPLQVTGSASLPSSGGAVVSGSANPHGLDATVWFEYGPTTAYTGGSTASQAIGSGTDFVSVTGTLTGLTSATPYHYRLGFANSEGVFYGADRTFNGPGYTVNDAVVTGTSVTLSASVNPNGYAGPSTNRTNLLVSWQYKLASSGSYTLSTTPLAIGSGTTAHPVSVIKAKSSLTAGIYNYRLVISSTLGFAYGPVQTFSVEPPTVTYNAPQLALTGGTLSATVNPNGLDTMVYIEYGLTGGAAGYTSGTTSEDIGSGFTGVAVSGSLSGLMPNTEYHYSVVSVNISGTTKGADQVFATQAMYGTHAVLMKGAPAAGIPGAVFGTLGNPVINDSDHSAFQSTVTGGSGSGIVTSGSGANNSGIWADSGTSGRMLIARIGTPAPGYSGTTVGTFATLTDPVYANDDAVAFLGTLLKTGTTAADVNASNNTGIWATTSGSLALVARTGDRAPDANGATSSNSPVFSTLTQYVLPDQGGVIFLASLQVGTAKAPSPGGVVAANNQGIWAVDTSGALKQIIRKGNGLTVNGSAKIISALTIFNAPSASSGQTRHFNSIGDLTYTATFTDGSSSIVQSVFP